MDEKKNEEKKSNNQSESAKPRRRARKATGAGNVQAKEQKDSRKEEVPVSKEPANLKDSVTYLKEVGLKKVSNKTFINEADLTAFLEGDFTNINKTRALGFIQILEREYPVKLDELKTAYLSQYQQNKKEKAEVVVQSKVEEETNWKKYIIRGVPALLLLFGGWYFATRDNNTLSTLESEQNIVSTDINTDVVTEAEKNLTLYENKKVDFTQEQEEEPINSPRVSPFRRGEAHDETVDTKKTVVADTNDSTDNTIVGKDDDLDLDLMVKQMVKEYNLTLEETNSSNKQEMKNVTENSALSVEKTPVETSKKKETKEKKSKEIVNKKSPVVKKEKKSVSKKVINSKLYIVPHKKSWVGIIYLDDYSKKDFLIRKTLRLNSTRPQLIVVGQKEFEIFNDGYSYRFRGKGPVRFIYKDGDIMEITNREFRQYSKGTAW